MMITNSFNTSYTVIGGLSKEVISLRSRCINILTSIITCQDKTLLSRLRNEFNSLEQRILEIYSIATSIKSYSINNNQSIDLLIELCSRPISNNQRFYS